MKKILILLGHPVTTAFSSSCCDVYERKAKSLGADVRRYDISDMEFDPVLVEGYKKKQKLEDILLEFQDAMMWADHFVVVYPNWWGGMPAKLKGLFDRIILPGFAFNMKKDGIINKIFGSTPVGHMKGKTARIINIVGSTRPISATLYLRTFYKNILKNGILKFCGYKVVGATSFGPTRNIWKEPKKAKEYFDKIEAFAKKDI